MTDTSAYDGEEFDGEISDGRDSDRRVCRVSGREQGLVGKYDIYLSRQAFREMARNMGFRKYD